MYGHGQDIIDALTKWKREIWPEEMGRPYPEKPPESDPICDICRGDHTTNEHDQTDRDIAEIARNQ